MRDRLLVPGLAVVGFAVTLAVTGWPHLGTLPWQRPAPQPQAAPPTTPVPEVRPPAPSTVAPPPVIPAPDAPVPAGDTDSVVAAPQPPLPDSAALPSYEEDQAARNADAQRSARSR